ncbi:lactate utilization protein C [Cytobacillus sp. Hz8]|uniref:LutC/YkgG family protein n=1 Tax=Cytobacillus sp. Hz8 TaxID=3347168 RepID=UPI0035D76772
MEELVQNRDAFLAKIAHRLGKAEVSRNLEKPAWKYHPEEITLKYETSNELVEILREQCKEIHTKFVMTEKNQLKSIIKEIVNEYGGGPIVTWQDEKFAEYGLMELFNVEWPKENIEVHMWDYSLKEENVKKAEKANVGITISDLTLAESATVVLLSSKDRGRTVSFLPETSIMIVPKSTIVPRLTQASSFLTEKIQSGELVPSCINFISGPSYSADIEMMLVLGVHGPVKAAYIVVEDL